jgi:hypothetical protein
MISILSAKRGVVLSVIAILIITVLEFPSPLGFETRPQTGVSPIWLVLFLVILVSIIAAIPLIYRHPILGSGLGIFAAMLNIIQVIADQAHLMQPEIAPIGYTALEGLAVLASLLLAYFSLTVLRSARRQPSASK